MAREPRTRDAVRGPATLWATVTTSRRDVKLVLDTSVLIDVLRGRDPAVTFLGNSIQAGHHLWSVTVVRTEVLAGMRAGEEQPTLGLLAAIRWVDVTIEIADRAGALARTYRKSHPGVDTVDYVIAAATEHLGATLCTGNVKHFPMFKGLAAPY